MAKQKDQSINKLVAVIAKLAVDFADKQVDKRVSDPLANEGVNLIFPLTHSIIEVLSDDNPDNSEQVKQEVLKWLNKPLADFMDEIIKALAERQEDENVKALLLFLGTRFIEVLRLLSDDDNHNKEQLAAFWESVVLDAVTHKLIVDHVVKPLLKRANATDSWIDFVVTIVNTTLEGLASSKLDAPAISRSSSQP